MQYLYIIIHQSKTESSFLHKQNKLRAHSKKNKVLFYDDDGAIGSTYKYTKQTEWVLTFAIFN